MISNLCTEVISDLRRRFVDWSVIRMFGLLVTLPLGLAVLEILFGEFLPETEISVLELHYAIFVYLLVAVIGEVVLKPIVIPELLDTVPFAPEIMLLMAFMGFYYLLTVTVLSIFQLSATLLVSDRI